MKKILLASLVAASTLFAQGAMADIVSGKIKSVSAVSFGITGGFIIYMDETDSSFESEPSYFTDCDNGIFGIGAGANEGVPGTGLMFELAKEAKSKDIPVAVAYDVDPVNGGCKIGIVNLGNNI